jgi:ribosomal protein L16 Arg81 hydroxylase
MYTPTFAELVGDETAFFAQYFNRAPLLRRQALRGDPRDLLSVADLDEILYSEAIRPPYVTLAKNGRPVVPASYLTSVDVQDQYVTDCVDPEQVIGHFRTGATITWNALNHFRPNLRALTAMLTERFGGRSDVVAFLTPAGREGYPPHVDPVDVFAIQLEGRKQWKVWPTPADRGTGPTHPAPGSLDTPLLDITLDPGDVLYLPYGTTHVAAAPDRVSLHLSVLVRPRLWAQLLTELVGRLISAEPALTGSVHPAVGPVDALADELHRHCTLLAKRLTDLDAAAELDALLEPRPPGPGSRSGQPFQRLVDVDRLTPDDAVRRRPAARVEILDSAGDRRRISVDGNIYAMPTQVVTALAALSAGETRAAGELVAGEAPEASVHIARTLARIGVVEPG